MKQVITWFIILMTITFMPSSVFSAEQVSTWKVGNSFSRKNLNRIIYFKGKYVAVGEEGTIRTSSDGNKWISSEYVTNNNLSDMCCTDKIIIAVGDNGTILKSSDGLAWKVIKPCTKLTINKITYFKGKFIAFLNNGKQTLNSSDSGGVNWKVVNANININSVVSNKNICVGVGIDYFIYTTADGIKWSKQNLVDKNNLSGGEGQNDPALVGVGSLNDVIWNGKMFVTVGDETTGYSYDGVHWDLAKAVSGKFSACFSRIAWNGKRFVAVGNAGSDIYTQNIVSETSNDGVNWSIHETSICGMGGRAYLYVSGILWFKNKFIMACTQLFDERSDYGILAASADGAAWDKVELKDVRTIYSIISNGKSVVGVGMGGYTIESSDAAVWKHNAALTTQTFKNPCFLNTKEGLYLIYNGTDFPVFTEGNIPNKLDGNLNIASSNFDLLNLWITQLKYYNGKLFAVGDNKQLEEEKGEHNQVYMGNKISDLEIRTIYSANLDTNSGFTGLCYNGKTIVVTGDGFIAASSDFENWKVNNDAGKGISKIICGQKVFVGLDSFTDFDLNRNSITISKDGYKWTNISTKDSQQSDNIEDLTYNNGKYVAVGDNGSILFSQDAYKWKKVKSPIKNNLYKVKWLEDSFYAVGSNCAILKSKDGVNWTKENINLAAVKNADFKDVDMIENKIVIAANNGFLIYKDILH